MITTALLLAMAVDLPSLHRDILADAQQRSQIEPAQVRVVQSEAVTWRDGSLGCPEPGRMYTQALVKGYRIRVQAGTALLEYHASHNGHWLYCPMERVSDPAPDESK